MSASVMVYNVDGYEFFQRVSLHQAYRMIHRKVADVLEIEEDAFGRYLRPKSVRLLEYRYAKWKYDRVGKVIVSRRGVLRRDNHSCAYCGKAASTIDHIMPRSRGGQDTWLNLVAACLRCNGKKADKTPKEAGMKLLFEPREPSFDEIYSWGKK